MPGFAPADYGIISPGTYELQNCELIARRRGEEGWWTFGDCDSARIDITSSKISRKARNRRVRTVARTDPLDLTATLAVRAMQFHDDVRSIAMLGTAVAHLQAGGPFTFPVTKSRIGHLYYVGQYDLTAVSVHKATIVNGVVTEGAALTAGQWKLVDEAAGAVQLLGGTDPDEPIIIKGTSGAIEASDARTRIVFMSKADQDLEIKIRGVSDIGEKFIFELDGWKPTPSGIDLIGGDDYSGQDLAGDLSIGTGGSVGIWQKLAA